jgi:hypothetical protein
MSDHDGDRDAIRARRDRFIQIALAGLASASLGACGPSVCLDIACPETDPDCLPRPVDSSVPGDGGADSGADAGSVVIVRDAGSDADTEDAGPADAGSEDAGSDAG